MSSFMVSWRNLSSMTILLVLSCGVWFPHGNSGIGVSLIRRSSLFFRVWNLTLLVNLGQDLWILYWTFSSWGGWKWWNQCPSNSKSLIFEIKTCDVDNSLVYLPLWVMLSMVWWLWSLFNKEFQFIFCVCNPFHYCYYLERYE